MKFQKLYKRQFGVSLNHDDAYGELSSLVRQMELVYKPVGKKQANKYLNEDKIFNECQRSKAKQ
jgi:hypothetical protein